MDTPLVTAMACVTIGAPEPDDLVSLIVNDLGWEVCGTGAIDPSLEKLWGIAPGSAGDRFTLLRSPGMNRGMIRVITGAERFPTRPIGARWTGVEIVVTREIERIYKALDENPRFQIAKTTKHADFSGEGDSAHRYFYGRGPGGTHFMFTMFVAGSKKYELPSAPAPVGHIFSVPLVSDDYPESAAFYRETLRLGTVVEYHLTEGPMHEAWGLPVGTRVDLAILKGDAPGFGAGGIELQGYAPTFIDPAPLQRDRFDGGTCLTTYTARDIDAAYRAVNKSPAVTFCSAPAVVKAAPYNGAHVFSFIGPSGERLEICEMFLR